MKVLITGASGLLGNHLTRLLLSGGYQVRAMIENEKANHGLDSLPLEKIICDIRDPLQVRGSLSGVDVVIHAAADTSVWPSHSEKVYDINVRGTENLIDEAIRSNVKRFIYVGSACAFGWGSMQSPGTENSAYRRFNYRIEYYETKLLAQQAILKAVRESNLPAIVVNPTFLIGPYDYKMNAARLVSSIIKRKFPGYPPGGRNFVHAKDVAAAICNAIESGSIGECYILGSENLSYRDFFRTVAEVSGQKIPMLRIPAIMVCLTGIMQSTFSLLSGIPPKLGFNMARGACQNAFYSSEKAIEHLHLSRTPISVAIQETIEWLHDCKTQGDE